MAGRARGATGDGLAWGLAAGCLLTLQLGLYWLALDTGRPSVLLQTGMQRHTGVVNPAGRYDDRCFVVLIESLHSPGWIRTMGLREASSLRRPLEISALSGERIRISADISVGMVHLTGAGRDVAQLLHEAEEMAMAARGMRSRAALLDEISRQAVPVENAQLGVSWHAMRSVRPHQARNGHGARPRKTPA
ncbi:hypothetical protein [Polaromonas sp.]|uniref:hypothetical protein n=1 Tax=Polaromonas sp. TaxID=1869339 RepID=UPI0024889453|nr:hypothetical protein [Polaromonas sp.]MDI1338347.1 hypothetical protein [Polaromonas sp.]